MRSGAETLETIEEALKDLKAQESSLRRELEEANTQRASLVAERLEALRLLAVARARDALADGVIGDADNLGVQVRALLEARQRTIAQLAERQSAAEQARRAVIEREAAVKSRIAALDEQLDRFGAQAREALGQEPAYRAACEAHRRLEAMLGHAAAKADQVARDEHEKGRPYRNDPLFMYLWQRRMGTAQYQSSGLIRMLDEWVARLIRYPDARANYAMLTEIPVRLRAHADDLRGQTEAAKARVDELEAARTRELAGGDLVGEIRAQRELQAGLDKELEGITSELAETGTQLKTYAKAEDQSFQTTVRVYAQFLDREPLRRLISDATSTRSEEDDRLVGEVQRLAAALDDIEKGAETRRRRLDQLSERKQEMARLASTFRQRRYDDVGSVFDDSPRTEDLLQLLLRGAITAVEYWARMQAQQHWRHRPADPWRRQSGLPPFGGFPGGGGGGDSGPDFKTGGSF